MSISRHVVMAAIGVIGVLGAACARGEVLSFAGRVLATEGKVVIVHADGGREAAEYPALLHGGDQLEFTGHGRVTVNIYGTESDITDQSRPEDRVVPVRPAGRHAQQDESLLDELSYFLGHARTAIPYFSMARTYEKDANEEEEKLRRKLAPSPFAPGGVAYILPGIRTVALVWRGAPTKLDPKAGDRELPEIKTKSVWATLSWPAGRKTLEVATEDRKIVWDIRIGASPPCPSWIDCARTDLSDVERISRAYWILKQGDDTWKVFAISELADLAAHDNFIAQQLWEGVRSGELADYLKDNRQ